MKYNPDIHHHRSIRLKGYDYSQAGAYFITICIKNRECLLGKIDNEKMILNDAGKMVETVWNDIPRYYRGFCVHENIVMPNHFHGIIEIVGAGPRACPDNTNEQPLTNEQPQGVAPTQRRGGGMKYNPDIHHHRSIRLKGYDYSQAGAYFITICIKNRECLLGKIDNEKMILNDAGKMVETVWNDIPRYYRGFCVHENIVMPNHFHGIIEIVGAGPRACPDNTNEQPLTNGQSQGVAPTGGYPLELESKTGKSVITSGDEE